MSELVRNAAPRRGRWTWSTSRSLRLASTLLAVAAGVLGLIELAFTSRDDLVLLRVSTVLAGWVYVAAGVSAWLRRPSNRLGFLITAGGFLLLTTNLDVTGDPILIAISQIVVTLPYSVLVHILLAFPSGRLQSRTSRLTVYLVYFVSGVLQAPLYLFSEGNPPHRELLIVDLPGLAEVAMWVQTGVGTASVVLTALVLGDRLRRADPVRRRAMRPIYLYGIVGVLYIPFAPNILPLFGLHNDLVLASQVIDLAGLAVAFTLSLVRGGFSRAGEVQELGAWLGTSDSHRTSLVEALRRALGDESVQLRFWSASLEAYLDETGTRTEPADDGRRGFTVITSGTQRIGAIEYDVGLNADAELVVAAGQIVAVALERERVSAELRASRQELMRSRVRIVEAADAERRRMARDLHDGLQVRLVLLALQAQQMANDDTAPPKARNAARALRFGLDSAAAEARGVVHAVLPAALVEGGLEAAIDDLVDHVPMSVGLDIDLGGTRLPAIVESTAYFVVAEAVGNAVKHAQATSLTLRVTRSAGVLRAEVTDNGVGGAHYGGGSGLVGLSDRVEALGGTLSITSDDSGTGVVAEVPDQSVELRDSPLG